MSKLKFLNTYVNNLNMTETVDEIEKLLSKEEKSYVVAINVDVVTKIEKDEYLKEIVDNAEIVLTDGQPLIWISKLYKTPIKEKVSGSDLVPEICKLAGEKGYKVFILGGSEEVVKKAGENLEMKYPGIKVVGTHSPSYGFEQRPEEVEAINEMISKAEPDFLFACLGCPKQEKYIYENISKYNAKVSICAGATVDFLAGNVKRAPKWMSDCGLEWFYRFLQEPKRLFKRYFVDDMKIIKLYFKYKP